MTATETADLRHLSELLITESTTLGDEYLSQVLSTAVSGSR